LLLCVQEGLFNASTSFLGQGTFGQVYKTDLSFALKMVRAKALSLRPVLLAPTCLRSLLLLASSRIPMQARHAACMRKHCTREGGTPASTSSGACTRLQ
jgi:hypothetical protein